MHPIARRFVTAAALAALISGTTACSSAPETGSVATPTSTPVATGSVEPTATAEALAVSSGDITSPASGTALRAALLKAASAGLRVSGQLTVYQLFAQETAAVGDVKPAGGPRMFFALAGGPDHWRLTWKAPFGSSLAGSDALLSASPEVSSELAGSIDWTKKAPVPKPAAPKPAPSLSSFKSFATKSALSMAGGSYTGTFTVTAKIAKDSKGNWWGNAIAEPNDPEFEPIGVWGRYSNSKWIGQVADFGTEDADAEFFPAAVLTKLRF